MTTLKLLDIEKCAVSNCTNKVGEGVMVSIDFDDQIKRRIVLCQPCLNHLGDHIGPKVESRGFAGPVELKHGDVVLIKKPGPFDGNLGVVQGFRSDGTMVLVYTTGPLTRSPGMFWFQRDMVELVEKFGSRDPKGTC